MVSFSGADRAVEVDVDVSPALVALALEGAPGFNEVVLPAVLAGTFELSEGGRRGLAQVAGPQPSSAGPWEVTRVIPKSEGLGEGGAEGSRSRWWIREWMRVWKMCPLQEIFFSLARHRAASVQARF